MDSKTQGIFIVSGVCRSIKQQDDLEARIGAEAFGKEKQLVSALLNKAKRCAQRLVDVSYLDDRESRKYRSSQYNRNNIGQKLLDKVTSPVDVHSDAEGRLPDGGPRHDQHIFFVISKKTQYASPSQSKRTDLWLRLESEAR